MSTNPPTDVTEFWSGTGRSAAAIPVPSAHPAKTAKATIRIFMAIAPTCAFARDFRLLARRCLRKPDIAVRCVTFLPKYFGARSRCAGLPVGSGKKKPARMRGQFDCCHLEAQWLLG
jgi:hypothetical protein